MTSPTPLAATTATSGLTPKREKFAQAYVECGNASEAYRRAGYSTNAAAKTITENASRLLSVSNVSARVDELKSKHLKRHEITVDDLIDELDEARRVALGCDTPQTSAAVSATTAKAKLLGLITDKVDNRVTTKTPRTPVYRNAG